MKVFRIGDFDNSSLAITTNEFQHFIENNGNIKAMVIEESLENSYLIVDANGYLVDNTGEEGLAVAANLLEDSITLGLERLNFNEELYASRY